MDRDELLKLIELHKKNIKLACEAKEHPSGHCPPVYTEIGDYPQCWNATPAGTTANTSCPAYGTFDTSQFVYKECWPNATWYVHPDSNQGEHWTNFSNCIRRDELEFNMHINRLFIIGYAISLVTLLISIVIFLSFRSLKCTRISLHIQLFFSFIMNNSMWLIWYCEVIPNSYDLKDNPLWCQVIEILLKYFLIANYMWMFCEGLYLHISLVVVFVRDNVAWIWFILIGWGLPFVIVVIYACFRIFHYQDTENCWLLPSSADIIYRIPVCITIIISFVFLCYALRVIFNIMNPNSENPAPVRMKRAARATLILIPLFGLQYILIPFRPKSDSPLAHFYEYVTVVITSLQGLCVSLLFCFANHDVHHAIARFIRRRFYAWGWSQYAAPGDHSAGVFVINSSGQRTSIRMI